MIRQHRATPQRTNARPGALALDASPLSLRYQARVVVRTPQHRKRDLACRVLNVLVASVAIVLTAPLMLLIAFAVKLNSPGPVIYSQPRVGVDRRMDRGPKSLAHHRKVDGGGRLFTIYKFRTMRPDDGKALQVWASKEDPRITTVGRILRATRLDEVPQFFNVLKGDMNIVGPRPEQPTIFSELRDEFGNPYRNRQRVLPGITGLAQVNLGYDTDLDGVRDKVNLDLQYIRRRSAGKDILIMAKTVPVMVFRKVWGVGAPL